MTLPEIQGLAKHWQARLRLVDWDIKVQFKPRSALNGSGEVVYDIGLHQATITVTDPQWDDNHEDYELVLVHELLHIKAAGFHNSGIGRLQGSKLQALEVMIEQTAKALVDLDREIQVAALESKKAQIAETLTLLKALI